MSSELFVRLGLSCRELLPLWLPSDYLDLGSARDCLAGLELGQKVLLRLTIRSVQRRDNGARRWLSVGLSDSMGEAVTAGVFGFARPWLELALPTEAYVQGKLGVFRDQRTLDSAELICPPSARAGVLPVYRGRARRVSAEAIAEAITSELAQLCPMTIRLVCGYLGQPEAVIARDLGYASLSEWLRAVHSPTSIAEGHRALQAAENLAVQCATVGARRMRQRALVPAGALTVDRGRIEEILRRFAATPTGDQERAIESIANQLRSAMPMRALLSADVGCGKSLVFLAPVLAAVEAGATAAIMVPREMLVEKTATEALALSPTANIIKVRPRTKLQNASGGTLYIGTTALLGALQRSQIPLSILVVDEQHVFSVAQREALLTSQTHYLEVSATPLPRSMAVLASGGLDIIELHERPVQRQVLTKLVEPHEAQRLFAHLRKVVDSGAQVAVVYPRIDASGDSATRASLAQMAGEWESRFPGKVAVLTGRDSAEAREEALARIRGGQASIIVATTVIELGLTLPELRSLVVIDPARLGTMQLHQLRGRVARLGGRGWFFMFSRAGFDGETLSRLKALETVADGFELAELELDRRGAGDLAEDGDVQSGVTRSLLPTLRLTPAMVRRWSGAVAA